MTTGSNLGLGSPPGIRRAKRLAMDIYDPSISPHAMLRALVRQEDVAQLDGFTAQHPGLDVNVLEEQQRETILQSAARRGWLAGVQRLVAYGADPCLLDMDGSLGPLHEAARSGRTEVVTWLVQHAGVPIDQRAFFGHTALSMVASEGDLSMVEALVALGADVDVEIPPAHPDGRTLTVMGIARQEGQNHVVGWLERRVLRAQEMFTTKVTEDGNLAPVPPRRRL